MNKFEETVEKSLNFIKSLQSFQEIFFCIRDWDSTAMRKDHKFGFKGGKEYLEKESKDLLLLKYWQKNECFLMPKSGLDFREPDLDFSKLNNQFNIELMRMIGNKLLNIDEMQIKTKPKTNESIDTNDLIELFESYINSLNAESSDEINKYLINSMNKLSMNENYREKQFLETNLDERHLALIQIIDSKTKSTERVLTYAETLKSNKVFGEQKNAFQSFGTFPFGINNSSSVNTDLSLNNQMNETENAMEVSNELEDNKNSLKFDVSSDKPKDIEMTDDSTDTEGLIDSTDYAMEESILSQINPHVNQSANSALTDQEIRNFEKPFENNSKINEVSQVELHQFCQKLLDEFRTTVEKAFIDSNFNFDLRKIHNDKKSQLMSTFNFEFKNKSPENLIKDYRNQLSSGIDSVKNELKTVSDERFKKTCEKFESVLKDSIEVYEKEMKASLIANFKSNIFGLNLTEIDVQNRKVSINFFEKSAQKLNNSKLFKKFSTKLSEVLNEIKTKYSTALESIKKYRSEMDKKYITYRYIPLDNLMQIHLKLKEKANVSLEILKDQELKDIVIEALDSIIESIKERNQTIKDNEEEIAEEVIGFVYDLFHKRFNNVLKSGLFAPTLVFKMHQKLLEYSLDKMITNFDFKEYQKNLKDKYVNELTNKIKQNYNNISSEYSEKVIKAKKVLLETKNEAILKYCTDMRNALSAKPHFKPNEFESLNSRISCDAIKVNEEALQCLKYDFNYKFYNSLVSENSTEINRKISAERDKFAKENNKNAPKVSTIAIHFGRQYLLAANYEKELEFILDIHKRKLRPNSIAFSDEILFGYEAKEYNEKLLSDKEDSVDKNFDIKKLIAKNRRDIENDELITYPFEFSCDKMKVKVDNSFVKNYISIESLIALQILDIKLDAEKQIGNTFTNAVLTLPTHYNLRQRNAFRDAAKIAGLENVQILSEITAAAVDYENYMKREGKKNTNTVFFLSINEFECDAAVCRISDANIEYKSFYNQNLTSFIQNNSFFKEIKKGFMNFLGLSKEKTQNEKFLKVLKDLMDRTIQKAIPKTESIDNIVIIGDSLLMNFIKGWTAEYFGKNPFYSRDPLEVIINGSAIFSQKFDTTKTYNLKITEVSFHPIYFKFEGNLLPRYQRESLIGSNESFPGHIIRDFSPPSKYNLPIKLSIFQDQTLVSLFNITSIPQSETFWHTHKIKFDFNNFGEIRLFSKLLKYNNSIDLNLIESKLGLTEKEIIEENDILATIEQKIKNNWKVLENISAIKQSKDDLEKYYFEIKKKVDNNPDLRGLKKKRTIAVLEETLKVIQTNSCDLKSIEDQKLKLEETVVCLKL